MAAFVPLAALALVAAPLLAGSAQKPGEWPVYGGNAGGQRYSPLKQITPANVDRLKEAWRFETGPGGLQASPLMINGVLYVCGPDQSVIALDAANGRKIWHFSSGVTGFQPVRGVTFWQEGKERRLFASSSYYLYALDPATGQPIPGFGENGRIDLREGLGRDPQSLAVFLTTPGIVWGDVIITGFRTGEGSPAAPGAVRAYGVRTGKLRWMFKTLPEPGWPGAGTWPGNAWQTGGGANNWAGMALDDKRGIVYVPTGSAVSDFYGADRKGDNLYANSLIALDARSGRLIWHFQIVHHDILDRDIATPPTLLTVRRNGRKVDAVVQAAKNGFLFVFDRVTGKPLFPIEERPVPQSDVPGEHSSPTQPFPVAPEALARQHLDADMLTRRTPEAHAAAVEAFANFRSAGPYAPLGTDRKTVIFPGIDGGAEWGGGALDPARGIYYINVNDVPWLGQLRKNDPHPAAHPGQQVYDTACAACHGAELKGNPPEFPSLVDLSRRLSRSDVEAVLQSGRGRMPAFPQLTGPEREALLGFLMAGSPGETARGIMAMSPEMLAEFRKLSGSRKEDYLYTGYEKFRDADGYPAAAPPWGTLNAVDINTGRIVWKVPLGEYPELVAQGMAATGSENYGGPLLTASRLLFIGATIHDRKLRAFDAANGALLWQTALPYAGAATPITYTVGDRQYVVIAASGSRDPKGPQGSAYVAYALAGE